MHAKIAPSVEDSLTSDGMRHEYELPVEHWSRRSSGLVNVNALSSRHDVEPQHASTSLWQLCAMQMPHAVVSSPAKWQRSLRFDASSFTTRMHAVGPTRRPMASSSLSRFFERRGRMLTPAA